MFRDRDSLKQAFLDRLEAMGKNSQDSTVIEQCKALTDMVYEFAQSSWSATEQSYKETKTKQMAYLSMEFLPGALLRQNLVSLGIREVCRVALAELDLNLEDIEKAEPDPGLGSGGLGRLAACLMDSMASLGLPGHGYGIRFKNGYFRQRIIDGRQTEEPDAWLKNGDLWSRRKTADKVTIRFGGQVYLEPRADKIQVYHEDYAEVEAIPYDVPIIGYENHKVNRLRLWGIDGDDPICDSLYPDDSTERGKTLRLKQEYFLVSASLQDILRGLKARNIPPKDMPRHVAIHINDTHPALAVPELIRLLLDKEGMPWDEAWGITVKTISYTNHTILSEALETWPVDIFERLLPRVFMIVEEINERLCEDLWEKYTGEWGRIADMAILADCRVRMGHLAVVGSHSVNGVAKIHTRILRKSVMKNFWEYSPGKFNNKTNGISHRRWLLNSNPMLANLVSETIGTGWMKNPVELSGLVFHADDKAFQEQLRKVKLVNKASLAETITRMTGLRVDPASLFDVQVKRIHSYKRQLLNILYIMHLYEQMLANQSADLSPRTFIFSGKAAPGYHEAKQIIRLIHSLGRRINGDRHLKDRLKIIFLENYGVSQAEKVFAAADLTEQISVAGKEASGTGNMKSIMNGAPLIGTLDGATVEILDEIGADNIFLFGLTESQVHELQTTGSYYSWDTYNGDARLKNVVDKLVNGFLDEKFSGLHGAMVNNRDRYFVLKDFDSYVTAQSEVDRAWRNRERWLKMSTINIAHSGKFSSDLTAMRYARDIWGMEI